MLLPIPPDIRSWIERKAIANLAPMNSVIVTTLRGVMESEQQRARAERQEGAAPR